MAMRAQQILLRPIITERATTLKERYNQVVFEVTPDANKHQVKDAVEAVYGVSVTDVRTMMVHGKVKRHGRSVGKRPNWKKATVTLKKGDNIDFFATE
jgi:large subunit ribosomal protein L23